MWKFCVVQQAQEAPGKMIPTESERLLITTRTRLWHRALSFLFHFIMLYCYSCFLVCERHTEKVKFGLFSAAEHGVAAFNHKLRGETSYILIWGTLWLKDNWKEPLLKRCSCYWIRNCWFFTEKVMNIKRQTFPLSTLQLEKNI